jgi:hypothetical protein
MLRARRESKRKKRAEEGAAFCSQNACTFPRVCSMPFHQGLNDASRGSPRNEERALI